MNDLMTKSFLSYRELKAQARKDIESELYHDLESGQAQPDPHEEGSLSRFFQEVTTIKLEMEEISNLLLDLRALNEETKTALSAKVLRGLRDRMKSDSISVLRKAIAVKTRLHSLEKPSSECNIAEVAQTRSSVTNGLKAKLTAIMRDFQALREKINSDRKEELRRRYFNSTGEEPSPEALEKMMASVSASADSLKKVGFLQRKEEGETIGIEKLEDDHEAVLEINRSLEKLHQIFLDMAVIVDSQGSKVDAIEENVATGAAFVSGGTGSLYYANQMKKNKGRWVHWVWAILLIIFLVCLVSLFSS
ncbi:hypothetical protein SAY86_008681 [Trapa natans]|uniref:t-SNARE coiled-coil homology domain-containing protein n=1 Tax=Trapa natans TaxID=22666 RepID=A0AAN7K6V1_TRANT|nr:hypothetical protein SAY86_008681 [Trapa natans]